MSLNVGATNTINQIHTTILLDYGGQSLHLCKLYQLKGLEYV
jgi:hypothetical protein